MFMLGLIGFTAPLLLLALLILPILWLILRAIPPAPIRRRFPGVALLLGLTDDETTTDRTPWWLLLLRMAAVGAVIIGFAGPVLNPQTDRVGDGPLLVAIDASWADARDWQRRMDYLDGLLREASRVGRPVALVQLTDLPPGPLEFRAADEWLARLASLTPNAWAPDEETVINWAEAQTVEYDTFWVSDGVAGDWRATVLNAFEDRGDVTVFESPRPILALKPAIFEDGLVKLTAVRAVAGTESTITLTARGLDPAGVERALANADVSFDMNETEVELELSLPPELRNRVTRFEISGLRSAGAVTLTDDGLKRREVAMIAGRDDGNEGLELLSPLHYLRKALVPTADIVDGALEDIIQANPDAIIFADVAQVTQGQEDALLDWIDEGGLLVRFAGPRLAASETSRASLDPLMPVRLRAGGRSIGGAMSWGEPKTLRSFADGSPFYGLQVPTDVNVTAQVMAQPDPDLSERVIAALADGTPLVTRRKIGDGQIILFHVTANAEWSSLPLSGLYVQMLERLAISTRSATPTAEELAGTTWTAEQILDGFGTVMDAGTLPGVRGEDLVDAPLSPNLPPGLYSGEDRKIARNVIGSDTELTLTQWPARIVVEGLTVTRETLLKGGLLALALALLAIDVIASLFLSGRLNGPRSGMVAVLAVALVLPFSARAQQDDIAIYATAEVVLAHVITGDRSVDDLTHAGLLGLSDTLFRRTSIEPAEPVGVNLETDELAFFPFLYWPITETQPLPSVEAYAKLNRYLRSGGMILFDTRDANAGDFGRTPLGRKLQTLARPLDIPPLEPIPADHVLTRTFYLLQDFPGRHVSRSVWVEAAPPDAVQVEGMPFRNLNDGVTPVVIGGNDWAAAWAVDERGAPQRPVGRGYAGERQREIAFRFGVNLIMHVLTGNYKSDQVHVPALLDRLGQ
jgi:hypothetical protein